MNIDYTMLNENRKRLLEWQASHYVNESQSLRLNAGCGNAQIDGYVNMDIDNGDVNGDIRVMPFKDTCMDAITCHHVLEHLPQRHIAKTIHEFSRILKDGGWLDIGVPDIELVCKAFLEASEKRKWNWYIYTIYGSQVKDGIHPSGATEDMPNAEGMFHRSGVSQKMLCDCLMANSFEVIESYHYDGFGTPSVFILARKV